MVESFFNGISPYFSPLWEIWNMKTSDFETLYLAYLWNYTFSLTHIIWKKKKNHTNPKLEKVEVFYIGENGSQSHLQIRKDKRKCLEEKRSSLCLITVTYSQFYLLVHDANFLIQI